MSVQKVFARPQEPHTWFDAFETPEEREFRSWVREFSWSNFKHLRDEVDAKLRCKHLMPLLGELRPGLSHEPGRRARGESPGVPRSSEALSR